MCKGVASRCAILWAQVDPASSQPQEEEEGSGDRAPRERDRAATQAELDVVVQMVAQVVPGQLNLAGAEDNYIP